MLVVDSQAAVLLALHSAAPTFAAVTRTAIHIMTAVLT